MRLTKVRVTKLFGLFDHEIPLNREERITIIHGPNGFGKTIVLRMIAALASGQYSIFEEVPFETFSIEVDAGQRLVVERSEGEGGQQYWGGEQRQGPVLKIELLPSGSKESLSWSLDDARRSDQLASLLAKSWTDLLLSREQDVRIRKKRRESLPEPEWLVEARHKLPTVHLVRTQRLDIVEYDKDESPQATKPTVEAYSEDLSVRIHQALAEYASRSQELDRTFPTRLFNQTKSDSPPAEELRKRLSGLEQKRSMLTRLGFLDPEQGLDQAPVQVIEDKREVLSVYVDDVENKLAVFDDMASKIQLFKRVVNERFLFKRLELHREQGFVFTSAAGAGLKPSDLSSGEQHELILLYDLLFKLQKNALVLIDEPEISLHVAWQEKFLGDLMEVVKLSEIDVVVATHSPEIIGEHWDLTVELKGPPESGPRED